MQQLGDMMQATLVLIILLCANLGTTCLSSGEERRVRACMSCDFDGFPNSYDENRSWWRLERHLTVRVPKTVSPLLRNTDAFGIMASSVALIAAGSMCGLVSENSNDGLGLYVLKGE